MQTKRTFFIRERIEHRIYLAGGREYPPSDFADINRFRYSPHFTAGPRGDLPITVAPATESETSPKADFDDMTQAISDLLSYEGR